jgi:hypothetical protein
MAAPFHSDSQMFLGVPPHVQVMACRAAAALGGESLYLDTWALLDHLQQEAPALATRLFEVCRRFPFVFGDVFGPTASLRGGSLVFTHTARPLAGDAVAADLAPQLAAIPCLEVPAAAGDLIVIHNHRLLHGRRAFEDVGRSFTRLLVWRQGPWPAPTRWRERAEAAQRLHADRLREAPPGVRVAYGLAAPTPAEVGRRLGLVLELLRGVPAGVLSARENVPEPELYRWRDAVLEGAASSLSQADETRTPEATLDAWLPRLR